MTTPRMFFSTLDQADPVVEIEAHQITYRGPDLIATIPRPFDPSRFASLNTADVAVIQWICNIKLATEPLDTLLSGDLKQRDAVEAVWQEICEPKVLLHVLQALEASRATQLESLDKSATQKIAQSVADLLAQIPGEPYDRMTPLRHVVLCIAECIASSGFASGAASTVRCAARDLAK